MKTFAHRSGLPLLAFAISATAAESQPPGATDASINILQHRAVEMAPTQGLGSLMSAESADGGSGEERVLRFATGEEAEQTAQRMRERLNDPAQRPRLVAEQRAMIEQGHVDAARVLGLDATMEHNLIELLTEQQMEHLDRFYEHPGGWFDMQLEAERITRRTEGLRALLGEQGLQRYQRFADSLGDRHQVNDFGAQLGASDALRPDQKDKLIDVLFEQRRRAAEQLQSSGWQSRPWLAGLPISEEGLQRQSQLIQIGTSEAHWRERLAAHREIETQAAAFLAPSQLNALSQWHRKEGTRLQRHIETLRTQAGMDPTIPEQPTTPVEDSRVLVNGQVQVEVRLKVNRAEAVTVTRVVQNGESFTFDAPEGLIAEATPRLYGDNWLDLQMKYYEKSAAGKRALQGGGMFGVQTRTPDGLPSSGGGGGTVAGGSKGYAVEVMVTASAL